MTPTARGYFSNAREEVMPYLPDKLSRVLEIGCGEGATMALIRDTREDGRRIWAAGIELNEAAASRAQETFDVVHVGDSETVDFAALVGKEPLDAILCLDVLEHLFDPWSLVRRISPLLRPGGRLVASIPNIRQWRFVWRLLIRGDFDYRDAGLLDRTHLRFFVGRTAVDLVTCGGLVLVRKGGTIPFRAGDAKWFLHKLSSGRLDDLLIKQYVVAAEATGA